MYSTHRSLSQLLSPSHATRVISGNADSVKKRWPSCSPCQHHSNLQHPGGVLAGVLVLGLQNWGGTGSISENWERHGASVPQHPLQTFPLCSSQYIKKQNKCLGTYLHVLQAPHGRNPIMENVYNCSQRYARSRADRHKVGLPWLLTTSNSSAAAVGAQGQMHKTPWKVE